MKKERGSSLVESLLVIVVIGSVVFLLANIPNALLLVGKSSHVSLAREIAVKELEDKRNINYTNLVNDTSPIGDPRISSLPGGSGTVVVADCDLSICTHSEHLKKITITVSWTDNSKLQNITLQTLIGEGGINQ